MTYIVIYLGRVMSSFRLTGVLSRALLGMAVGLAVSDRHACAAERSVELLNASCDPTRELWKSLERAIYPPV